MRDPVVLSEAIQWRLLEMVHSNAQMLWANMCLVAAIGCLTYARTGSLWALAWGASGVVIAIVRIIDFYGFRHRRATKSVGSQRRRYTALAWLLGAHWGTANVVLAISVDPAVHFWFINSLSSFLAMAVSRSNPVVDAVRGQVMLTLIPMFLGCIWSGDLYMQGYSLLVILYIFSALGITEHLHRQTVNLLVADETNAGLVSQLRETHAHIENSNRQLAAMASTDGLTGIANRRRFDEVLVTEWNRASKKGHLSLLLIDIDHFKAFNDRFGHQAGDDCLQRVALSIAATLRDESDIVARYGGEEFAVILPDTDTFGAIDLGERIRNAVQAMAIPAGQATTAAVVTISTGAATVYRPPTDADHKSLVASADLELYRAKREGRNCVRSTVSMPHVDAPARVSAA